MNTVFGRKDKDKDAKAPESAPGLKPPSDADKSAGRQWFKKGNDCRQKREYDYAIECYLSGLNYWPDAVEEGLMPLRSLALQRAQAGGKKPSMMDSMKRSMTAKDGKQAFLNAVWLLSWSPKDYSYAEGLLKNAAKLNLFDVVKFAAPAVLEIIKEPKPSASKFRSFRELLVEVATRAEHMGQNTHVVWFYETAVGAVEWLRARMPNDEELRQAQRDLSSRLTIMRGKYAENQNFRESIQDAGQQKLLHDADRVKQGEQTLDALIAAARKEAEANPTVAGKINALVDALLKRERPEEENEAIAILMKSYLSQNNYSFKSRADDIRLRQLTRRTRETLEHARSTGADHDKQQARLTAMEQLEFELNMYKERCDNYPTDLRLKFKYGQTLFKARRYDDAIPILQQAQADPRSRVRCELLIGRCFLEKGAPRQAVEVLKDALASHEASGDDLHKELLWHHGQALEAAGASAEASAAYNKLLRLDYTYADGEVRRRMEALGAAK
ncbi:MAG: hypothetical protein JNG88_12805 [Phycisphaerales bacterium]|nr:hypothetical protein [Phycisphaerales bacterium]